MISNRKNTEFFHCNYDDLEARLQAINPVDYGNTRNYLDGAVTWASPFVAHGIIDTKHIADAALSSYNETQCEKLLFELAWREYFHRVWQLHGDDIFSDMKHPSQSDRTRLPGTLITGQTGVEIIDETIDQLLKVGNMHNHARMWVASLCCNMGNTHWLPAARWMHYHLLDGDLASNTLSWQWIAGTFSNKRYFANQSNINKFSKTTQHGTFLDVPYEAFNTMSVPDVLSETADPYLYQILPGENIEDIEAITGTVALRSVWHLRFDWHPHANHQWVFIDTDLHSRWPMSENRWAFIQHWAQFIPGVRFVKGTSAQLHKKLESAEVQLQEYTATNHWFPPTEDRRWLYPNAPESCQSFSKFWKRVK